MKLSAPPSGLRYVPDFLSEAEESSLLQDLESRAFDEVRMRGVVAKRTTLHFGVIYGYESWKLSPGPPIPAPYRFVLERAAPLIDARPEDFEEVLLSRYPEGAGIGWHRDAPMFGPDVIGISLGASCVMKFRRRLGERSFETWDQPLAPRSLYVLGGDARTVFQHSITKTPALRYSITLRTLKKA